MDLHLLPFIIFFTRCEEHSDIDFIFQPPMDNIDCKEIHLWFQMMIQNLHQIQMDHS